MAEETRDHLFFQCAFARSVWNSGLARLGLSYYGNSWAEVMVFAGSKFKGGKFTARIGRLAFNVIVYCLWQERNNMIFSSTCRTEYAVLKDVEYYIVAKMWNWSVSRSYDNWVICKSWGIDERVLVY